MYNLWNRVNAVFFYGLTALFIAAAASNFTTLWFTSEPRVYALAMNDLRNFKAQKDPMLPRSHVMDRAVFTIDLDADLSGVFNWNVKQLFVFVTANYPTSTNAVNQVVLWDRVVQNASSAVLRLAGQYIKYPLMDQGKELRGTPVSLTLHWDVMPITGKLYGATRGNRTVRLPAAYCSESERDNQCRLEAALAGAGFDAPPPQSAGRRG